MGGICAFSSCDHTSDCSRGFVCDRAPAWAESLTLGLAQGVCDPTCFACPHESEPRWTCHPDDSCTFDSSPRVDAGGPYEAVVGEPLRLVATVDLVDGRSVAEARWKLESFNGGYPELGNGLEIDAVIDHPRPTRVFVVVTDDRDRTSSAWADVSACSPVGGPCSYSEQCCDDLQCRDDDGDGNEACELPPVCGDGVIEGAEECDGAPITDVDCTDYGQYHPGQVACSDTCTADVSACEPCGESFHRCSDNADCCPGYVCDDFFEDCVRA